MKKVKECDKVLAAFRVSTGTSDTDFEDEKAATTLFKDIKETASFWKSVTTSKGRKTWERLKMKRYKNNKNQFI